MIARKEVPAEFETWNRLNGAPEGRVWAKSGRVIKYLSWRQRSRLRGMYGIQPNSPTRRFEYPWAWHAGKLSPGLDVLEIGGGLSGFQFSLSRSGCRVTNVDPGMDEQQWPCTPEAIETLNEVFGTSVRLIHADAASVHLPACSFDRVFSISVMEHLDEPVRRAAMGKVFDCLRPGGKAILTVDLFLDLAPFTPRLTNRFGSNCDIRQLIEVAPFRLLEGREDELFGFEAFSADRILQKLPDLLVGVYPVLAQCLVLEKPMTA